MNRKAIAKKTVIEVLIALVVLFIIILGLFWPGTGLLWKAAAKTKINKATLESESKLGEVEIPKEGIVVFDTLTKALKQGKESSGTKCIITHDDFPDFNGLKIVLSPTKDNGLSVVLKNKDDQVAKFTVIPGLSPCLVADYGARNFYDNYFNKGNKIQEFIPAQHVELTAKETLVADNTKYDLEDNDCCGNQKINVLYKADADHVCFITTFNGDMFGGCNADDAGLDDDCISNTKTGILAKIKHCPI